MNQAVLDLQSRRDLIVQELDGSRLWFQKVAGHCWLMQQSCARRHRIAATPMTARLQEVAPLYVSLVYPTEPVDRLSGIGDRPGQEALITVLSTPAASPRHRYPTS